MNIKNDLIFLLLIFFMFTFFLLLKKNFKLRVGYTYDSDLYVKPKIYNNFISNEECDQIINMAKDNLKTSTTLGYEKVKLTEEKKKEYFFVSL